MDFPIPEEAPVIKTTLLKMKNELKIMRYEVNFLKRKFKAQKMASYLHHTATT